MGRSIRVQWVGVSGCSGLEYQGAVGWSIRVQWLCAGPNVPSSQTWLHPCTTLYCTVLYCTVLWEES